MKTFVVSCLLSFLFLSSTASFAAPKPPVAKAEWTVMVFMNAKNNLECAGLANFHQMAAVGSSDKVNMLVEFGRPQQHESDCPGDDQTWSGVLRYRVTAGMKPTVQSSISGFRRLKGGPRADMGSRKNLSEFIKWSMTKYPANRYMLVIWNHGQGFRLQLAARNSLTRPKPAPAPVAAPASRPSITGGVRAISFDDDSGNYLFNSDITQALADNIKGKPIDILGFDACLMSMLETAYQMKGVAHHMIASEDLEPDTGWNYTALLKAMGKESATIDSIAKDLENAYAKEINDVQEGTLSHIDLRAVDGLATAVSEWALALMKNLNDDTKMRQERDALARSRKECKPYGSWYDGSDPALQTSVDLHRLAALDAQYSPDPDVQAAALNVVRRIEDQNLVRSRYTSPYSDDSAGYGSWGLAIYFPSTLADFQADSNNSPGYIVGNKDHPVLFVDHQKWAPLLQAYYASQTAPD